MGENTSLIVGTLLVGASAWLGRQRDEYSYSMPTMGAPPSHNRCCPSGARMLSSGTCQDTSSKRFVKSIPCAQVLGPRRVRKVGMEPVRTWPAPRRIGGW